MIQDLLALNDLEPPMGDLFTNARFAAGRALWTTPLAEEVDAPDRRIIHSRVLRLHGRAKLHRLGVRKGPGYHKCGSRQDLDWVTALRLLVFRENRWTVALHLPEVRQPADGETLWFELGGVETTAVSIEVRRSGIDDGWTPWNLALSAFTLEGELIDPRGPRRENLLALDAFSLARQPKGVTATLHDGQVRYRTRDFEVGFYLSRPGFTFFGLHTEDAAHAGTNLLVSEPALFFQGPQLHEVGAAPVMIPAVRCDIDGTCRVQGNRIAYDFTTAAQRYRLIWTVTPRGLTLEAERHGSRDSLAWLSSIWTIGLRNSAAPTAALGRLCREGEAGALELPLLLNFPRFGTLEIAAQTGDIFARSDCFRSHDMNLLELHLGERRTREGLYLLPKGKFKATVTVRPVKPSPRLRASVPAVVKRAVERTFFTALTLRADTGTLSNNGASMHCPICLDTWSAVTEPMGEILPDFRATELVRYSLERWLTGGPGYAAGRLLQDGVSHDAADEYLMTGTAALRGLGDYLRRHADAAWFKKYRTAILRRIDDARGRDLDGDGLIESAYRTGVSGTGQWSTCWYDVISFGWKDALANAILYSALQALAPALRTFGLAGKARELETWAATLHKNYRAAFWNDATGWLAGWRCKEDRLHDYAFLAVNGAAVCAGLIDAPEARALLARLLREAEIVGLPDAALGLPGNLRSIADADLADIMQGYPLGYYQNGGRTHAQSRHFVMALYHAGLTKEADALLERLCVGFADARVFGGNQSGVDWRYWDDRPCGYEGLLTDQFGVLEAVFARWGRKAPA
ncbi:hypothetical protein K0B96_01645 [Horticoccus luteus]|uniref:Alpha-L-rhamnosidase six-hairpin glycosidase domain-containing protein n=1 Tax=Horticoccus luteus TaxID=2862869 RepID=A0A8F9TWH6_9BACT|nr:hypothetical protein [Horticoccus luteus]QYM79347.1 hypothetical protein K0B96_01645 [Horticoccus luteus]